MEWPVLGPQVIGRVTSHPESFLVSHAYLSVWIVDPDSLGREDESAWDSTGGACNSGTARGLDKTLQHSTLVPLATYKKCGNARLCRTFPRRNDDSILQGSAKKPSKTITLQRRMKLEKPPQGQHRPLVTASRRSESTSRRIRRYLSIAGESSTTRTVGPSLLERVAS